MSWTDTSYTSQPLPSPPTVFPPSCTHTPSLHFFYSGTLCQQKNKREGKAREGAGEKIEKGVKEEGEIKKKKHRNRRNQTLAGVGERSVLTGSEVKLPS